MQAAQHLVLDQAGRSRAEREQVDRRHPPASPWLCNGHDDPLKRWRCRNLGERGAQLGRGLLARRRRPFVLCVQVEHGDPIAGQRLGVAGKRARGRCDIVEPDVRAGELPTDSVEHVAREHHVVTVQRYVLELAQ